MIEVHFHPMPDWPEERGHQNWSNFKAGFSSTLYLLDRELNFLGASDVVIEAGFRAGDIRRDGWPRERATALHPGIRLHFDTRKHGHLRYSTQEFHRWQDNLRAIALGLEALRKVDRYGITRGGEQYKGFGELPSGIAMPAARMTTEEAARFIAEHSDFHDATWGGILDSVRDGHPEMAFGPAYRMAAKKLHPDNGGDTALFQRLQDAVKVLTGMPTS